MLEVISSMPLGASPRLRRGMPALQSGFADSFEIAPGFGLRSNGIQISRCDCDPRALGML